MPAFNVSTVLVYGISLQLVVLGPGHGEQRWEAGPNRTLTLQPPPPEDILPPPPGSPPGTPPTAVSGHYVVLCHWGITGCSQALYRPNADAALDATQQQQRPGGGGGVGGAGGGLSDKQVLSLVHFTVPQYVTVPGQHLVLVGSVPALGGWNPTTGVQLKWGPGHNWSAELLLQPHQDLEAKVGRGQTSYSGIVQRHWSMPCVGMSHLLATASCV